MSIGVKPFNPVGGGTIVVTNSGTATPHTLAEFSDTFAFYNSSATAIAFIRVTAQPNGSGDPVGVATVSTDMPVPPGAQIRLEFGYGKKSLSAVASAADGNLYVTPGTGN